MITKEKIEIFESYGGDMDDFVRTGRARLKKLFDDDDWFLIDSLYQDIDLINKSLVAREYLQKTLSKLKDNCDKESFEILAGKIKQNIDYQNER